jgi:AAA domain
MSLLQPAEISSAFLKMGILGLSGAGKTKTAGKVASGLVLHMKKLGIDYASKPVAMFDTETGSDWLIPDFQEAGVPFVVAKRKTFADLLTVMREAEQHASVLIIDSITHPWRELCESYMKKKQRSFLQIDDYGYLKGDHGWAQFTNLFVNSKLHIVMCGRAGDVFENYVDDNGKRQMEKIGTKMKTEGETAFEPSLLVLMEHVEDMRSHVVIHRATVQKDRSTQLDGHKIDNPDFRDFLPHIERLNLGGKHLGVDDRSDSQHILTTEKKDWAPVQREICIDEIQTLLTLHYPSQGAEDKKNKLKAVLKHFDATWTEIEKVMPLPDLRAGYDSLHQELEGKPSRYGAKPEAPVRGEFERIEVKPQQQDVLPLNDDLPDFAKGVPPLSSLSDAARAKIERHVDSVLDAG